MMGDLGLLVLRLVTGGLLAGHGAQKAFGAFGGYGFQGVVGWLESLGLKPAQAWAGMVVAGELGGGALTALGLANPLGPILASSAMAMAWAKGHAGEPIWASEGGAELPLTNIAVTTAMAMTGPSRYSLDNLLGIRVPGWMTTLTVLGSLGTVIYGMMAQPEPSEAEQAGVREELAGQAG